MGQYAEVKKIQANPEKYAYARQDANYSWILRDRYIFDTFKNLDRAGKILDIGCWSGYFLNKLYEIGFRNLYGVDMVDCRNDFKIDDENFDGTGRFEFFIRDMNMDKLPFNDNTLDVVTCFQTIEHLENYFHILHEVTRVLKPDGMFIMSVPNPNNFVDRVRFLLTGNLHSWNTGNDHLLFLTKDVFKKTYRRDFDLVHTFYDKGYIPFWGRLNMIPFVHVGCRKLLLPRGRFFGYRVCYTLKLKPGVK